MMQTNGFSIHCFFSVVEKTNLIVQNCAFRFIYDFKITKLP